MIIAVPEPSIRIFLTSDEMATLCTPGEGAETCIWLVLGRKGFECLYLQRSSFLLGRLSAGETVAKRDGCDFIKTLDFNQFHVGSNKITTG